jgi:phosphohistidine phosphatase SixA
MVGISFTALAAVKIYGMRRGIVGGGGKPFMQRACGSCPSWGRAANRALVWLFLAVGLGNLAWAGAVILHHPPPPSRVQAVSCLKQIGTALAAYSTAPTSNPAQTDALWSRLQQGGCVIVMRHARTPPGSGDPPNFRLDDRSTQRNLSDEGRADAKKIGEVFRAHDVRVGRVLCSPWFRARDTGELAFDRIETNDVLGALAVDETARAKQIAAMRALVSVAGQENLVLITHQTNVAALTGLDVGPGECVVLLPQNKSFTIAGTLKPLEAK